MLKCKCHQSSKEDDAISKGSLKLSNRLKKLKSEHHQQEKKLKKKLKVKHFFSTIKTKNYQNFLFCFCLLLKVLLFIHHCTFKQNYLFELNICYQQLNWKQKVFV